MRKQYDFSKAIRNPYAAKLKKQITIRIDRATVDYFKALANELGIRYQNLMNLFLRECAVEARKPSLKWTTRGEQSARFDARIRSRKSA